MFDNYAKRLKELGDNVPNTFSRVAKNGAVHFENTAKTRTDEEKLVDTGAYKRNWNAQASVKDDIHTIRVANDMEYASHLEYGHKKRNGGMWKGRFVGAKSLNDTEAWVLIELRKEIEALMLFKKTGVSRGKIRKQLG